MDKAKSVKAVLLISSCDTNASSALIIPLMGMLAVMFPGSSTQISMLISLPSLVMIPTIFLSGKLSNYFSKKTLLNIGTACYIIGGFGACLYSNLAFIVVMRGIVGIGCGIVYPLIPALIAQFWEGDQRAKMMGWASAAGSILAMGMSMASGFLAVKDWRYPFYLDLLWIILLIAQIKVLPKVPPERKDPALLKTGERPKLTLSVYLDIFAMFVYLMVSMVYILKISIFISAENLGNAANAGLASSAVTFCAFLISLVFTLFLKYTKRFTSVVSLVFLGICFYLLSIAHSFSLVVAASVCMGFSLGLIFPYLNTRVSAIAPPAAKTFALSVMYTAGYTGQFLAAFYAQAIDKIVGGSLRGTFQFMVGNIGVCIVIATVCILISMNMEKKKLSSKSWVS